MRALDTFKFLTDYFPCVWDGIKGILEFIMTIISLGIALIVIMFVIIPLGMILSPFYFAGKLKRKWDKPFKPLSGKKKVPQEIIACTNEEGVMHV